MKIVIQSLLLIIGVTTYSQVLNSPPEITALGNQEYCPQSYINIVEDVDIIDLDDSSTTAIYIQISSGYNSLTDRLYLQGSHPTIRETWNASTGKLTLQGITSGTATYFEFIAAIKNVVYFNSSSNPSGNRSFSITVGAANYLPTNGHYYEFVSDVGITWTAAKVAAESRNYYGMKGYLATLTSMEEAVLAGKQSLGAGWIGGSDAETEGIWKWVTGPDAGTQFWQGTASGFATQPHNFSFWNNGEPNQYLGANEDYAHITANGVGINGSWNDLTNTGDLSGDFQPKGYIVEYGGMPGDPILKISASTKISIPVISNTMNASRCSGGNMTLQATSDNGRVYWYQNQVGGMPIATGLSYTSSYSASTTLYVSPFNESCNAIRTPVTATVHQIPAITSVGHKAICGTGIATLSATSSGGEINWYDSATSSVILNTGTNFSTPFLSSTTSYFVEAYNNGCSNGIRVPVTATVNQLPVFNDETVELCEGEILLLDATYPNVTYKWSTGDNTALITVNSAGIFTVTLTDINTLCTTDKTFEVSEIKKPKIREVVVNYNQAQIITQENGLYEYTVDSNAFQSSPQFDNLKGGVRTFIVNELNGCGNDSKEVLILLVPRFITPNNDSYNDYFLIEGLSAYPEAIIQIFDRFGRILYTQYGNLKPWDGTYNGSQLPSSDYWYTIHLSNNLPEIKGHFTVKRN